MRLFTMMLACFAVGCGEERDSKTQLKRNDDGKERREAVTPYACADVYLGMRDNVLGIVPSDLPDREGGGDILAAMMEIGQADVAVSLVCVSDGTTSMYISNGGGVIGSGTYEPVAMANSAFLEEVARHVSLMETSTDHPLPLPGEIKFYVVGTDDVKTLSVPEEDLEKRRHEAFPLYLKAHDVITEIRKHQD